MPPVPQATILVVEDTRELAEVIARELEVEGYRVVRAVGGQAALVLHARERPDLVVPDWMLPGISGLDVLHKLRARSCCGTRDGPSTARTSWTMSGRCLRHR